MSLIKIGIPTFALGAIGFLAALFDTETEYMFEGIILHRLICVAGLIASICGLVMMFYAFWMIRRRALDTRGTLP